MMEPMTLLTPQQSTQDRVSLRGPIVVAAGVVAAFAVTAVIDPNEPGHYPTCPFLWTTGWYCPGCGTMRAMHALAHGDPVTALQRNPLFVVMLVVGVVLWVRWLRLAARGQRYVFAWPRALQIATPIVVAGYWIIRNVPGFEFLGP